jgi:hypothetical protein
VGPALSVRTPSTQSLIGDPLQSKFPKKSEASLAKKGQLTLTKFFSRKVGVQALTYCFSSSRCAVFPER